MPEFRLTIPESRKRPRITILVAAVAGGMMVLATSAAAQTGTTPPPAAPGAGSSTSGGSAPVKSPSQVDEGQLNILPSAGNAGPSAAPTMVFNCKERPKECTEQVKPGDKSTAPKLSN
jgi:hypothetical protein